MSKNKYMLVSRRYSKKDERFIYSMLGTYPSVARSDAAALGHKGRYGDLFFVCDLINAASVEANAISEFAANKDGVVMEAMYRPTLNSRSVALVNLWENTEQNEKDMMSIAVSCGIGRKQLVKACHECCKYIIKRLSLREKRALSKRMNFIKAWFNGYVSARTLEDNIESAFRLEAMACYNTAAISWCAYSDIVFMARSAVGACCDEIRIRNKLTAFDNIPEILNIIRKHISAQDLIIASNNKVQNEPA